MFHSKGSNRLKFLVMARRFAFSVKDVLLHAFRFSSFSVDIPGGRCGGSPSGGSHSAGLASVKKRRKKKKNVESGERRRK